MSEVQILLLLLLSGYLISVSLGMVIIPRILVISHKKRLYDVPDSRKVHTTPVPRLGGLSFFPVVLMSFALVIGFRLYLWPSDLSSFSIEMLHEYLFLFVGMTLLYLVGVCDDLVVTRRFTGMPASLVRLVHSGAIVLVKMPLSSCAPFCVASQSAVPFRRYWISAVA